VLSRIYFSIDLISMQKIAILREREWPNFAGSFVLADNPCPTDEAKATGPIRWRSKKTMRGSGKS
jgi:hypothetical protein